VFLILNLVSAGFSVLYDQETINNGSWLSSSDDQRTEMLLSIYDTERILYGNII
jgi:hypothetical protein